MAPAPRLDPAAVSALLRRRWNRGHRGWLDGAGSWPLSLLLHPPTERETVRDLAGIRDWIEQWAAAEADPARPGELLWTVRHWPGLGRQRLPERLVLTGPEQVALWIGEWDRWGLASERAASMREVLSEPAGEARPAATSTEPTEDPCDTGSSLSEDVGDLPATSGIPFRAGRHFDWLADAPADDFERLLAVVGWLIEHPVSGLYVRQLPIPGIDTKWIGANRGRLLDLLSQHWQSDGDLHQLAGLRREPDLVRLRLLDPNLRAAAGGLGDITAPVEQVAGLPLAPERVIIVENLQTGLAFGDLQGTVCFMARGYAVEAFGQIPWLRHLVCHYWGDLDTHGFAILNRLRHYLPAVRSLLMDSDTLLRHRTLWQREEKPATGPLEHLTPDEQAVFESLLTNRFGDRVRLEQERIDWRYAEARCCALVT